MSFAEYVKKNWDGWPLHSLIAGLLTVPVVSNNYQGVMFAMNCVFWPTREMWQHKESKNIWTPHRIMEWAAPIVTSGIVWWVTA